MLAHIAIYLQGNTLIYLLIIFSLNDHKCGQGKLTYQSLIYVNFPSYEDSRTYNSVLVFIFLSTSPRCFIFKRCYCNKNVIKVSLFMLLQLRLCQHFHYKLIFFRENALVHWVNNTCFSMTHTQKKLEILEDKIVQDPILISYSVCCVVIFPHE